PDPDHPDRSRGHPAAVEPDEETAGKPGRSSLAPGILSSPACAGRAGEGVGDRPSVLALGETRLRIFPQRRHGRALRRTEIVLSRYVTISQTLKRIKLKNG